MLELEREIYGQQIMALHGARFLISMARTQSDVLQWILIIPQLYGQVQEKIPISVSWDTVMVFIKPKMVAQPGKIWD